MAETLILVDEVNTTVGYAPRQECHAGDGHLHRAIAVVLVDRAQRILLQHRKSSLWDGFWDLTGATHTLYVNGREETSIEAANRCLRSEWDLENFDTLLNVRFAFTYFERHGEFCENEYCFLLTGHYDGPVSPNPDRAHGFRWVELDKCKEEVAESSSAYTPWARIALSRLAFPFS
jgi:isopentenyl-diphosphate delta-isomerase